MSRIKPYLRRNLGWLLKKDIPLFRLRLSDSTLPISKNYPVSSLRLSDSTLPRRGYF